MEKSVEQLKEERHLLWVTLSNCHTALSMANTSYLPVNVKRFVEMALEEARYALDKTVTEEHKETDDDSMPDNPLDEGWVQPDDA